MDKFGLIGYPIAHSLSPVLFGQAYGGKWAYELVEEPTFEGAWQRFISEYKAVNVTAPYKERACAAADIVPGYVRRIGACNILVKTPDGILAHNSDYLGVKNLLSSFFGLESPEITPVSAESFCPRRPDGLLREGSAGGDFGQLAEKTVLIIGYGGAGKAAATAARDLGMDVVVCNRTTDKAAGIRPLDEIPILAAVADMVIYTLPCAIAQIEGIRCPALLEANYRNPVLSQASGVGRYISGREWIVRQASMGYGLMTGEDPGPISLNN